MGGHGALVLYLKNLDKYQSASAFAPIANPTKAPWGEKAFGGYLRGGVEEGKAYDATELIGQVKGQALNIKVDVGTGDNFYKQKQRESRHSTVFRVCSAAERAESVCLAFVVLPENFIAARDAAGYDDKSVQVQLHDDYGEDRIEVSDPVDIH
jgi:S-formylglutathione hydrolase